MTTRLVRLLLKLYPRAIRDRYGKELLHLAGELKTGGDISRSRLLWDVLRGALLLRPTRSWQRLVASAAVAIVGLTIAITSTAAQHRAASVSHHPSVRQALVMNGGSCFVGAGTTCSEVACAEFTDARSVAGVLEVPTRPVESPAQSPRDRRARCARYARPPTGRAVFVGG